MPYIAILTDGKSWAFVKSTNRKRKHLLTKQFSKAKRFTKERMEQLQYGAGRYVAWSGALLEFHEVKK